MPNHRVLGCVANGAARPLRGSGKAVPGLGWACRLPVIETTSSLLARNCSCNILSRFSQNPIRKFSSAVPAPSVSSASPVAANAPSLNEDGPKGNSRGDRAVSPLPEGVRRLLRHLASSVVVCTALPDTSRPRPFGHGTAIPVGLTMSSFTSLSLYPSPVVTFNIAMPSRTEAAIAQARHFMVHVLSGDANGARIADVFRSGNAHPDSTSRALDSAQCRVVRTQPPPGSDNGADQPFLSGPGILYVLRCRLLDEPMRGLVPVRDHVVVLAEVMEIAKGEAEANDSDDSPLFGLIYADRHYRQLQASVVDPDAEKQGPA